MRPHWQSRLRWMERVILVSSLVLLAVPAVTVLEGWLFQRRADQYLISELQRHSGPTAVPSIPLTEGGIIGRIEIPRLRLSVALLEGTTPRTLRLGAGHLRGTAMPGAVGNSAIAAHRDTFFRALRGIHQDDEIHLQTLNGVSIYRVDSIRVVSPANLDVLKSSSDSELTLVTCYPFYVLGAASDRFIVHAHRQPAPASNFTKEQK
jgi:sortase A